MRAANPHASVAPTGAGEGRTLRAEIEPAEIVILEGVSASREVFRPYLAYVIWIETPREERLRRGLERVGEDARDQWERWMAGRGCVRRA